MRIGNNPALRCLTEDACQAYNRDNSRQNNIPQDISRAHRRQLVHISYQNQAHPVRHRLQQAVHENRIHHGTLVDNQDISVKRMLLIALIALRRFKLQQTVNRFRLQPCHLTEPFCRSSGRRCQENLGAGCLKRPDNAHRRRALSGARSAGQYHNLAFYRGSYGIHLNLVILNSLRSAGQALYPGRNTN